MPWPGTAAKYIQSSLADRHGRPMASNKDSRGRVRKRLPIASTAEVHSARAQLYSRPSFSGPTFCTDLPVAGGRTSLSNKKIYIYIYIYIENRIYEIKYNIYIYIIR